MNLLSIGGSDPTTGAGVQSDVKVFNSLNVYPLTVITAITSQNTQRFGMVEAISKKAIESQIIAINSDFQIDGIKISMVYNSSIIKTLSNQIRGWNVPIVLDPVIESTTGGALIKKSAIPDFRKYLLPIATITTPNKFEAEVLSKTQIKSEESLFRAAKKIQDMGSKTVVITGIEKSGKIIDYVFEPERQYRIEGKKIFSKNHGSGCNYSAAMLIPLVKGNSIKESVKFAKKIAFQSIKNAKKRGKGITITEIKPDKIKNELATAIESLKTLPTIAEKIPECQTNFVFSKPSPKSRKDVLGVLGRIVKTGNKVTQAGELSYGASKHVATALIVINKKFPEIRAAINIRYQTRTLKKLYDLGYTVLSYDRKKEPSRIKEEGSSVNWGIKHAIKKYSEPPDVIYHKGDFGKEPMILIFGKNPDSIIRKLSRL